ncbi:MAG: Rab geranylgeranyltransferase [Pycnora praestabilis]|nr:MAG: Rab geranylgeranyltransferase [Pycnora praestabilis]
MTSHGVPRVSSLDTGTEALRKKELVKIKEYQELVDLINTKITERQYTAEVLALISRLLTHNPEYYTIWNHRRLILKHQFSAPLEASNSTPASDIPIESPKNSSQHENTLELLISDLQFLVPLLRKFPKCYWIWNHRLWLLQQSNVLLPASEARRLWEQELGLVGKMLSMDSRNFHGWGYRRTVISHLESPILDPRIFGEAGSNGKSMVEQEFAYTTKMIETNLSNFSAWHNRSKLIPRLLDEREADDTARRKFLDDELSLIQRALYTDPYDQSLWFYHQNLICTFSPSPSLTTQTMAPNLPLPLKLTYLSKEITNIQDMLDGAEDCKWIYKALIECTMLFWLIRRQEGQEGGIREMEEETRRNLRDWVTQLRALDPLRRGRWDDLELTLRDEFSVGNED